MQLSDQVDVILNKLEIFGSRSWNATMGNGMPRRSKILGMPLFIRSPSWNAILNHVLGIPPTGTPSLDWYLKRSRNK